MDSGASEVKAVSAVNQRFYDAIEQRDFDAMAELWEHTKRVTCVHPGWPIQRGWQAVANSWLQILGGPKRNEFILTNASISIEGDLAWVVLDEDLVGDQFAPTTATVNLYAKHGDRWLMILHHGSSMS